MDLDHSNLYNGKQYEKYGEWEVDFILKLTGLKNGQAVLNANRDDADGYLAGQYDGWELDGHSDDKYLPVPWEDVVVTEGEEFAIMGYAFDKFPGLASNFGGNKFIPYAAIELIETFNCGIYFTPEFLAENPELKINLGLYMFDPVTGERYPVCQAIELANPNFSLQDAVDSALSNSSEPTVELQSTVTISEPVVVDGAYINKENKQLTISLNTEVFDLDGLKNELNITAGTIFELRNGASVEIVNINRDANYGEILPYVRQFVPKEYCVTKGSIVIRGSHQYVNGVCECGDRLPTAVPATADNSNMPLWSLLFIGFAAVAVLTAKKKKA